MCMRHDLIEATVQSTKATVKSDSKTFMRTISKRVKVYLLINTVTVGISLMSLAMCSIARTQNLQYGLDWLPEALAFYLSSEIRMFMCIGNSLAIVRRHKDTLDKQKETIDEEQEEVLRLAIGILTFVGLMEVIQYQYLTGYFHLVGMALPASPLAYGMEYLAVVPKSLLIELVMDFFHYWMYRCAHKNKWLFRFAHHTHHHPTPWTTYEQSLTDIIMTNMFPFIVALLTGHRLTIFQLHLILTYKTLVEVNGHNGVPSRGKSFPQFPLLGFCTDICLDAEDHHEHHRVLIGNYSKRFRFWDDVFGTYIPPKCKQRTSLLK